MTLLIIAMFTCNLLGIQPRLNGHYMEELYIIVRSTNIKDTRDFSLDSDKTISSIPLTICMCDDEGEPNCSIRSNAINEIMPGEQFNLSLAAMGQVNATVANLGVTNDYILRQCGGCERCSNSSFQVLVPNYGMSHWLQLLWRQMYLQ